jgi:hypothetical protein
MSASLQSLVKVGLLLLGLAAACASLYAVFFAVFYGSAYWLSTEIRSRVRVGQSMTEVLTVAEEGRAKQGPMPMADYVIHTLCEDSYWLLLREPRGRGRAQFRLFGRNYDPSGDGSQKVDRVLSKADALVHVDANARGCTARVRVIAADEVVLAIADDGTVEAIKPPSK